MTKKLLHKTSRIHLLFSIIILIVTAPVFYFITKQLYLDDADETLILRKKEFLKQSHPQLKKSDISTWNKFNRDVKIIKGKNLKKDSIFNTFYFDALVDENEPYRELNAPIFIERTPYTFTSRIDLVESEDLILSIAELYLILIFLFLIGQYIINKKLSEIIWKPFYNTLKQIEAFEIDKASKPKFLKTSIEEFNRLNQSIENLIDKNLRIYQHQKEFTENAAHELQTPLAVFQGKLDLLIQQENISQEHFEILTSLNNSVAHLKRLNKNLLLFSNIENNTFIDTESLIVNNFFLKNLDFFKEQAKATKLKLHIDLSTKLHVVSNPILLEILINNLFLNAIKHNIFSGSIHISITENCLAFTNTGTNVALNSEKIFSRFSKAATSKNGNGLGLAIVKKITDLNHWKITYSYTNHHHCFILHF
ncbi:HAMP domain-containing sensor histidine kinase [Wenyingzhuangia sp. 2_MG-2023]|uniref:sensor histidine kinase n=1 Tax=Wenyingzhuangia sp. 2_MG-2023 TaxID=3062639 RepID=UPI0026E46901|nr:HAMP domain-containing sensor histidine kinase [Wenyingzhuangia sp. 2_MG-2023]MDO6736461.1 HAMP domain-containing sensor histidine kinase [Wenyingzhuangia sp. 2_MG-2023]